MACAQCHVNTGAQQYDNSCGKLVPAQQRQPRAAMLPNTAGPQAGMEATCWVAKAAAYHCMTDALQRQWSKHHDGAALIRAAQHWQKAHHSTIKILQGPLIVTMAAINLNSTTLCSSGSDCV